ncbi:hypothetical protein FRB90_011312 [Tulasnella sp. 427]|nr:hypothetical protein FRB90_011312 [Tulasnella sp. 427]
MSATQGALGHILFSNNSSQTINLQTQNLSAGNWTQQPPATIYAYQTGSAIIAPDPQNGIDGNLTYTVDTQGGTTIITFTASTTAQNTATSTDTSKVTQSTANVNGSGPFTLTVAFANF